MFAKPSAYKSVNSSQMQYYMNPNPNINPLPSESNKKITNKS